MLTVNTGWICLFKNIFALHTKFIATLIGRKSLIISHFESSQHNMFVHTSPEKLEKVVFALKTHQMFSVHTSLEEFENATINGHFGFVFEEMNSDRENA